MEIDISTAPVALVLGATGLTEIIQNVRLILTTPKGSVPLDRAFGLSQTFLDHPGPAAMALAMPEIFEAVEKYEPRVKVTAISWENSNAQAGIFVPRVRIKVLNVS